MKPCIEFRWVVIYADKIGYHYPPALPIGNSSLAQVLQQLWRDDAGNEEWRDIPMVAKT